MKNGARFDLPRLVAVSTKRFAWSGPQERDDEEIFRRSEAMLRGAR